MIYPPHRFHDEHPFACDCNLHRSSPDTWQEQDRKGLCLRCDSAVGEDRTLCELCRGFECEPLEELEP